VPQCNREHRCFSCHNNGDGTRALLAAANTPFAPKPEVLTDDTLEFLKQPSRWDKNGVDAAFSDKSLARLQFASALSNAIRAGRLSDRQAAMQAGELLVKDQADNGSWPIDDAGPVGSPVTYGPMLATATAIETLRQFDAERFRASISKAEAWLQNRPIQNTDDAASVLLVTSSSSPGDQKRIDEAINFLKRGQNSDGGYGPFSRSASEPFDTALAVIALARFRDRKGASEMRQRGRDYLIKNQKPDGSWTESTRPAGAESYAQRISTTSWATMALLSK
jgi:hypothetical protein